MSISINFHGAKRAKVTAFTVETGASYDFVTLDFEGEGNDAKLFLPYRQLLTAQIIASIFNGDYEDLAERIEDVLSDTNDMDVTFADFALAVACDLTGKDLTEAHMERRERRRVAKEAAA